MSSKDMNLSVNGNSQVPPGFRFHPTEEELLHYYLRKKVASQKIDLDVIRDVDLNKLEPWDIQERCKIGSTPQNDWYFFSHKDKKYPTGTRTNRATTAGFWKATGRDKVIYSSSRRIGMRKTLVFYMGRAPHGQKSDWIMHEYRLDDHSIHNDNINLDHATSSNQVTGEWMQEDGWVVCRVFTKKNYQRATEISPKNMSYSRPPQVQMITQVQHDTNPVLDQILDYMGKNCKQENNNNDHKRSVLLDKDTISSSMMQFFISNEEMQMRDQFIHLPRLDHSSSPVSYLSMNDDHQQIREWVNGCGGSSGHLSDMIFDHIDIPNAVPAAAADGGGGGGYGLCDQEHNDEGAIISLLLPELLPMNDHFNRSMSTNNKELQESSSDQHVYISEVVDLWTFSRSNNHISSSNSSSDPLGQLCDQYDNF